MSASTSLDLVAMNGALKELYDNQTVENLVYADNPFLAMIPKKTDFGGKYKPIPIVTGVSQGRSSVFANAQGNQSAVQIQEFLLTRKKDYSIATIDNETMLASTTDKVAFLDGAKILVDGAIRSATLSLASAMFRSGTGSIGQVTSIASGVITLADPQSVTQFEVNMTLQADATDGGVPRAALGYVIAVNRRSGIITVSATGFGGAAGTPSGWVANDFLLVQGDVNAKVSGLQGWLPNVSPVSGDNWYGVDRSVDSRLYGEQYDGSSQSIEEALIDHQSLIAREGGKPGKAIVSYASFSALEKALGSKVQYFDAKSPANIAFRGILLNGANTTIEVFPDRSCPSNAGFMLQMENWTLQSLGDAPRIFEYDDGLRLLRNATSDSAELRCGYFANVACNAPGWSGQTKLSA